MNLRLPIIFFSVTVILGSTLSCTKKDEPTTSHPSTGSYKLDGVSRNCEVKSAFYPTSSSQPYDQLDISLSTVPQPASGEEHFVISFTKKSGQPTTAYQLYTMGYYKSYGTAGVGYANDVTTLQEINGNYSGTFSATEETFTGTSMPRHLITSGVFT
ncbi:MAG: hypothetical protein EOO61_17400, partial [Hymenobacter sp.]